MQNKEAIRTLWKEAGILFAITLVAGIILGYVYELTKEPIRLQQEKAIQEACQEVFQEAEEFRALDYALPAALAEELAGEGVTIGTVYEAFDGTADAGELLGYVVETTSGEGYAGDITLYAGIRLDGTLNGISILEISETPGLGMRAEEVLVPQFAGKNVSAFRYTKTGSQSEDEIDAISGATFTTNAVTSAVNGALRVVLEDLLGGGVNE